MAEGEPPIQHEAADRPSLPGRSRPQAPSRTVRICTIDLGQEAGARGQLASLVDAFRGEVARRGPGEAPAAIVVDPRIDEIPRDCALYLSTGGPGSPVEHWDEPWLSRYRAFLDWLRGSEACLFAICYSFEVVMRHLGVGALGRLHFRRIGVMDAVKTDAGEAHPLLAGLGRRFPVYEYRSWEVAPVDEPALARLGGQVLARDPGAAASLGSGALAVALPRIEGVQFHAEADPAEVLRMLTRPEWAAALRASHGDEAYLGMLRACEGADGLPRVRETVIPRWLARAVPVAS
jgi:GMP synthase-like glutamine amidotransferase